MRRKVDMLKVAEGLGYLPGEIHSIKEISIDNESVRVLRFVQDPDSLEPKCLMHNGRALAAYDHFNTRFDMAGSQLPWLNRIQDERKEYLRLSKSAVNALIELNDSGVDIFG